MSANSIVPDAKDWTWVLDTMCPECEFDVADLPATSVSSLIRENAVAWHNVLDASDVEVRERPQPDRWSSLEYAAHVRDVYRLYVERLTQMLETDDPLYANWDQDETALVERYNEQDPSLVGMELVAAADALADAFDAVTAPDWQRPGRRGDGAVFTVETFARYLIHDPIHHLWDVTAPRRS
jgi:DinB superfamily